MNSVMKRGLAMLLALMLVLSNTGGLAQQASAAAETGPDNGEADSGLLSAVADNYFGQDGKGQAILNSGALLGDEAIEVTYPAAEDGLVTLKNDVLTAADMASGYAGLSWKPYSCTIATDTDTVVLYFEGNDTLDLSHLNYENAQVIYHLTLSNFTDSAILKLANLPAVLTAEAKDQRAALDTLSGSNLGMLTPTILELMYTLLTTWTYSTNTFQNMKLQKYFGGVVEDIRDNRMDPDTGTLKLYNLVLAYEKDGLSCYYANSEEFLAEVKALSDCLDAMLADEEKKNALDTLSSNPMIGGQISKLTTLQERLNEVEADLVAPNDAIDTDSENLDKLVEALDMDGTPASFDTLPSKLTFTAKPIVVQADNRATVTITVNAGGKTETIVETFHKKVAASVEKVETMKAAVEAAVAASGIDTKYYINNYENGAALDALVGTLLTDHLNITYTWTPVAYTVVIDGEEDRTITVEDRTVTLPSAPAANCRYDYVIGGRIVPQGKYTFTLEEIDTLFAGGTCTLTRTLVNLNEEELDRFVSDLNAIGGENVSFTLNEDRTELTAELLQTSGMTSVIIGFINSGYSDIQIGGYPLVYKANGSTEVSLQSLVNAMIDSGLTSQDIIEGQGALTVDTTLCMKNANGSQIDLILHLTINSGLEDISQTLALSQGFLSFRCEDGVIKVEIDLPDELYEVYLASMLLTGNADLSDVNVVNSEVAHSLLNDYLHVLLGEDVTTTTYANTLAKLDREADLSAMSAVLEKLKGLEYGEGAYDVTMTITNVGLKNYLSKTISEDQLALISMVVKELKEGGQLSIQMTSTITDMADTDGDGLSDGNKDYEAVIVVPGAMSNGSNRIFTFTTDLLTSLETLTGPAVIILQQDIEYDLSFDTSVILDLNGRTVRGSITAGDTLVILDRTMETMSCGRVTGTVAGTDVSIIAGEYDSDVTAFLPDGYVQEDGMVTNELYHVTVDEMGNLTFLVDAAVVGDPVLTEAAVRALSLELCGDLLLNYYTVAALSFGDGMDIYEVDMRTVAVSARSAAALGMAISSLDCEGISAFINSLMADLTDYGTIAEKAAAGQPIASYTMSASNWVVDMEHNREEDCFDLSAMAAESANSVQVSIQLADDGSDAAADLAEKLDGVIASDMELTINSVGVSGSNVLVQADARGQLTIDLSADPAYAAFIALALAADGANQAELVTALNRYFSGGNTLALKEAFEKVTVAQLDAALADLTVTADPAALASAAGVTVGQSYIAAMEAVSDQLAVAAGWIRLYLVSANDSDTMFSRLVEGEDGSRSYVFITENDTRSSQTNLHSGYGVDCQLTVSNFTMTLYLFGGRPKIEAPALGESESIYAYYTDEENCIIYIDTVTAGITKEEFESLLILSAVNDADGKVEIKLTGVVNQGGRNLVPTGATAVLTAKNADGLIATEIFNIVIVGDTNCNGRIENNDAVRMMRHFVGAQRLDEMALKAADVNCNGRLDNNDAVLNTIKFVRPGDYSTKLG